MGVLPPKENYLIYLDAKKDPEILRFSNCHRDAVVHNANDKFTYRFTPNPLIESGSCLLQISALDSKGYHQFGAISFRDTSEDIEAAVYCNGKSMEYRGASVCQAKVGTTQVIEFKEPMQYKESKGCQVDALKKGQKFKFTVKEGYCLFLFRSENGGFHKLTTFGYNNIVKK